MEVNGSKVEVEMGVKGGSKLALLVEVKCFALDDIPYAWWSIVQHAVLNFQPMKSA